MVDDIASKIKKVADVCAALGIVGSILAGLGICAVTESPVGLILMAVGSLMSWVISLLMRGFGEIVEAAMRINQKLAEEDQQKQSKQKNKSNQGFYEVENYQNAGYSNAQAPVIVEEGLYICPNCGTGICAGNIGLRDEKCRRCKQKFDWDKLLTP